MYPTRQTSADASAVDKYSLPLRVGKGFKRDSRTRVWISKGVSGTGGRSLPKPCEEQRHRSQVNAVDRCRLGQGTAHNEQVIQPGARADFVEVEQISLL